MKKSIKHHLISIFLVLCCVVLTLCAAALKPGDVINYVLATEIRAFINGYEIPSYNIDGRLGIVAEDLRGYGFDVVWNADIGTLDIKRKAGVGVTNAIAPEKASGKINVGERIANVLFTEIVTYLDGRKVESFNIDGRTIIYFKELAAYGTYLYDNDIRASMISYDRHSFKANTITELPKKIIHAGGEIGGFLGSNSLEALDNSYSKGFRVIEMDFVLSSDGAPVCLHNWSDFYSSKFSTVPSSVSDFASTKIFDRFTSVTLDSLVKWLQLHNDVYIVTDVKENNIDVLHHIADAHPEIISRIIPQIYQYDEYLPTRAMGYSNIVLTLYRLPTYENKADYRYNSQFAKKYKLLAVTADATLAKKAFVDAFVNAGVPLYVHTVNDASEQQEYIDMGITGIYTDFAR